MRRQSLLRAPSFAPRNPEFHKGDAGRVVVVGGSLGLSGAPRLAGAAAFRAGAGLVTLAVPGPVRVEVAAGDPTLMVRGFRATLAGTLAVPAARDLLALAAEADAVVLGPGLGRHEDALALARRLHAEIAGAAVVDADALTALAGAAPAPCRAARVFTPHPGEAARLLGVEAAAVQADRAAAARALQERLGSVVVLKGHGTLVTDGRRLARNPTGNPGLAHGGTGDVLAGLIGGFLAQGLEPYDAAAAAVWIHGEAADRLRRATGERGLTPDLLLGAIPATIARHERARRR